MGEEIGYRGSWVFGLHATRLRGHMSSVYHSGFGWHNGPTYDAEDYREVTTATHLEALQQPWAVAER
jgi:hypothetical protein